MKENLIPVFFTVDDGYAPFLSVALKSMIDNSSVENNYVAIIVYQELSEENIGRLKRLEKDHFKVEFSPMKASLEAITDTMSNRLRCDYFTLTIYFRLFIPRMFPQFDKAIYIDSDVVVNSDIAELYGTDIGNNLIGACTDLSVAQVPELVNYMENAVGVPKEQYINSGVLLLNMKALRDEGLEEHFLNLLSTYHFDAIAPDQDYLNAMCNGRIYYLDSAWDTMPEENTPEDESAKLIHYNLFSKPWCYDGISYADLFWSYAEESGYIEEIRAYKANYDDEKKKSDTECLGLLVNRGNSIPDNDITFKKMIERGEKIRL